MSSQMVILNFLLIKHSETLISKQNTKFLKEDFGLQRNYPVFFFLAQLRCFCWLLFWNDLKVMRWFYLMSWENLYAIAFDKLNVAIVYTLGTFFFLIIILTMFGLFACSAFSTTCLPSTLLYIDMFGNFECLYSEGDCLS